MGKTIRRASKQSGIVFPFPRSLRGSPGADWGTRVLGRWRRLHCPPARSAADKTPIDCSVNGGKEGRARAMDGGRWVEQQSEEDVVAATLHAGSHLARTRSVSSSSASCASSSSVGRASGDASREKDGWGKEGESLGRSENSCHFCRRRHSWALGPGPWSLSFASTSPFVSAFPTSVLHSLLASCTRSLLLIAFALSGPGRLSAFLSFLPASAIASGRLSPDSVPRPASRPHPKARVSRVHPAGLRTTVSVPVWKPSASTTPLPA